MVDVNENCFATQSIHSSQLYRLKPHPLTLIGHFFAVALYAVYRCIKAYPPWKVHKAAFRSMMIFVRACKVIFPLIGSEVKTMFPQWI